MSSMSLAAPTLAISSDKFPVTSLMLPSCVQPYKQKATMSQKCRSTTLMCYAALGTRCAAEQTATVTRQSSTISIAPVQGKEKSPDLDDGGTGFPPRDNGGGGGGGGGGGPHWSGGFIFFAFLAFLGFLKDKENEGPYKSAKRRNYA